MRHIPLEGASNFRDFGGYDTAGKLLKKYNFTPPPAIAQSWQSYPAIKKLEYAYLAAETATPGPPAR